MLILMGVETFDNFLFRKIVVNLDGCAASVCGVIAFVGHRFAVFNCLRAGPGGLGAALSAAEEVALNKGRKR